MFSNALFISFCDQVRTDETGFVKFSLSLGDIPEDVNKLSFKVSAADVRPAEVIYSKIQCFAN